PPTLSWAAAYDHATPRTWQYLVNVERQLATNWSVGVGYRGSQSRHLYGFQTLNQAGPGPLNTISSRVPYPTFGVISYVSYSLKGHYNAFSVKATRRYGDGLSLNTSYTLAKSIDNSSGTRTQGFDTLFPQGTHSIACESGLPPRGSRGTAPAWRAKGGRRPSTCAIAGCWAPSTSCRSARASGSISPT